MMFVSAIVCIDTFFVSYFLGLHSRSVDVEDPTMKPIQKPAPAAKPAPAKEPAKTETKTAPKKASTKATPKKTSGAKKKKH